MTDAEGRNQFESLAAGLFRVHAYPNVYVAASRDFALREGEQSSDFDLVLENAASLDVERVGSPGKTLEDFELSLRFVGKRTVHAHSITRDLPKARGDDADLFRFAHLPAGTLRQTLSAPRLVASGVDPFTFWATSARSNLSRSSSRRESERDGRWTCTNVGQGALVCT
jgi:hypothetical protein